MDEQQGTTCDELRRARITLETVRKELKSELDRAREREISLREQLNNERAKNAAEESRIASLERAVKVLQSDISAAAEIRKQRDAFLEVNGKLTEKVTRLERMAEVRKEERAHLFTKINDLGNVIAEEEKRGNNWKEGYEQIAKIRAALETKVDESRKENEHLRGALGGVTAALNHAENKASNLRTESERLIGEKTLLEEQIDALQKANKHLREFADTRDRETREIRVEFLTLAKELDAERTRLHKTNGREAVRVDELIKFCNFIFATYAIAQATIDEWHLLKARVTC